MFVRDDSTKRVRLNKLSTGATQHRTYPRRARKIVVGVGRRAGEKGLVKLQIERIRCMTGKGAVGTSRTVTCPSGRTASREAHRLLAQAPESFSCC